MCPPGGKTLDNLTLYGYAGRMTTYGWQNEAGEPIMDGAAYRFEQQLDYDYAEEQARMAYDEDYYSGYFHDEDEAPEWDDEDDDYTVEDGWLDGSYEE